MARCFFGLGLFFSEPPNKPPAAQNGKSEWYWPLIFFGAESTHKVHVPGVEQKHPLDKVDPNPYPPMAA